MFDIAGSAPRKLWQNDDLKTKMSTSAMYGGHVYGISEKKAVLLCLDGETGRTRWEERGFGQYGTLIIAGDRVVALTDFGELVIAQANPDRYVELDRAKVLNGRCWVSPVLSNQRIYARNNGGDLVCLRLARK